VTQETERHAFIRKLSTFRATLSPIEGRALDTILRTAEGAKPVGDVEAYGWFFGGGTADPDFITGSTDAVAPGETTGWWQMYSSGNNPFRS
jgi:hypothetical protein